MDTTSEPPDQTSDPPRPDHLTDEEIDVDLADEEVPDPGATAQEEIEFLGEYESLEAYFQSQLEDLMSRSIQPWIWECLDWRKVQAEMEAGRWRYVKQGEGIYRTGIPTPPDPSGPWMLPRGGA